MCLKLLLNIKYNLENNKSKNVKDLEINKLK